MSERVLCWCCGRAVPTALTHCPDCGSLLGLLEPESRPRLQVLARWLGASLGIGLFLAAGFVFIFMPRFNLSDLIVPPTASLSPAEQAGALIIGIDQYVGHDNWTEVERVAREAVALDPNVTDGYYWLGEALYEQGRLDEARDAFAAATRVNPTDAASFHALGWSHLNGDGDLDAAEAAFREAHRRENTLANALSGLGHVQLRRGQLAEAEASFRAALGSHGGDIAAYQGLAELALIDGDFAAAAANFNEAATRDPGDPMLRLAQAYTLLADGRHDEALAEARKMIDQGHVSEGYLFQARVYESLGRFGEARTAAEAALAADPNNPYARELVEQIAVD